MGSGDQGFNGEAIREKKSKLKWKLGLLRTKKEPKRHPVPWVGYERLEMGFPRLVM